MGNGEKNLYKVVLHPRSSLLGASGDESVSPSSFSLPLFNCIKPSRNYYDVGALKSSITKSHHDVVPNVDEGHGPPARFKDTSQLPSA